MFPKSAALPAALPAALLAAHFCSAEGDVVSNAAGNAAGNAEFSLSAYCPEIYAQRTHIFVLSIGVGCLSHCYKQIPKVSERNFTPSLSTSLGLYLR